MTENLDSVMFDFDGESIYTVEFHKMSFKSQVLVCQNTGKRWSSMTFNKSGFYMQKTYKRDWLRMNFDGLITGVLFECDQR